MRVLVTGGSGFIGRNIVEQLRDDYEILAPAHAELELTDAGAVAANLAARPVQAVIHCAVRPGHRNAADPSLQLERNLRMFFNLARCAGHWERMIYLSSGAVYDIAAPIVRAREDEAGARVPRDEHGFSRFVIAQCLRDGLPIVELRPFGVFGKYEDYAIRFISNAICKSLFDLPVTLRQDRRFSYLFIDDLMPVLSHFLEGAPRSGAFNVVPDEPVTLLSLARKVVAASGKDLPIVVAREGLGLEYTGDNAKLKAEMPALHTTPIDDAVADLFDWYEANKEQLVYDALLVDK